MLSGLTAAERDERHLESMTSYIKNLTLSINTQG